MNRIRYQTEVEIEAKANRLLQQYHPSGEAPVPIEKIVECRMRKSIVALPQLRRKFGIDGFISMDLETITVDQELMVRFANRYRFTLAHEIAHGVLHRDFITAHHFESIQDWQDIMMAIPPTMYGRIEAQAYLFAGFLLVPSVHLCCAVESLKRSTRGIDLDAMGETAADYMADNLAEQFDVSAQVVIRRLTQQGLARRNCS